MPFAERVIRELVGWGGWEPGEAHLLVDGVAKVDHSHAPRYIWEALPADDTWEHGAFL